ncbi:hypothetical protein [Hymenobacter sp. BT730]|uniref:DinB/UmuC family translesion DNA polymerase n=1 Tax=Hymenobacter sp. BT730 TaxID=3063332 RepID=UPI0034A11AC1
MATQDTVKLVRDARTGLKRLWQPGQHYPKAGIVLDGLEQGQQQLTLFEPRSCRRSASACCWSSTHSTVAWGKAPCSWQPPPAYPARRGRPRKGKSSGAARSILPAWRSCC